MSALEFYVHPKAIVESASIGSGTRVWAFSHVMKGAKIGRDCNVGEQCYIESGVVIGDDVVIKNGVALWEGVQIGDRAFLGPNCSFTNDLVPRSKLFKSAVPTLVREGASIGANATIICGIEIGAYSMIGAGAVVTRNVPDYALVVGNPARFRSYICRCGSKLEFASNGDAHCKCGTHFMKQGSGIVLIAAADAAPVEVEK